MSKLNIVVSTDLFKDYSDSWRLVPSVRDPSIVSCTSCYDQSSQSDSDSSTSRPSTPPFQTSLPLHASPQVVIPSVQQRINPLDDCRADKQSASAPHSTRAPHPFLPTPFSSPATMEDYVVQITAPAIHNGSTWTVFRAELSLSSGSPQPVILKIADVEEHVRVQQEFDTLVRVNRSNPNLRVPHCYGLFWNNPIERDFTPEKLEEMFGRAYGIGSFVMMCEDVGNPLRTWRGLDERTK